MAEENRERSAPTPPGYAPGGIRSGPILSVMGALLGLLLVAGTAAWILLNLFQGTDRGAPPPVPSRAVVPVEPKPQVAPERDLAFLRAEEERLLHSEAIDAESGFGRIPIEQAMTLLVQRARKVGEPRP